MPDDTLTLRGRVGPQRLMDSQASEIRLGNAGEIIVQELNGRFYEQTMRGNMFVYSTASTGIALAIAAVTGNYPSLWNPSGSGYNFVPVKLLLGYLSGANVPGNVALYWTASAGSAIGTTAPVVTWTNVAGVNALIGGGRNSYMKWSPAVHTTTAVPTFLTTVGLNLFTGLAATAAPPFTMSYDFDGTMVVAPGNVIHICANPTLQTMVATVTLIGMELPIPATAT
jgi:hypothetical protein